MLVELPERARRGAPSSERDVAAALNGVKVPVVGRLVLTLAVRSYTPFPRTTGSTYFDDLQKSGTVFSTNDPAG